MIDEVPVTPASKPAAEAADETQVMSEPPLSTIQEVTQPDEPSQTAEKEAEEARKRSQQLLSMKTVVQPDPTALRNKLQFDVDGVDADNILYLYNEVTFLPKRFEFALQNVVEDLNQVLESRLAQLGSRLRDEIHNNNAFIQQNKTMID